MPSLHPQRQKMLLLCNPKSVCFFYYKSYKKFSWHKILYISQASNYSFFLQFILQNYLHLVTKSNPPSRKYSPTEKKKKKKSNCHIFLIDIYTETHHFGTMWNIWLHMQNDTTVKIWKEVLEKEITIYMIFKGINKRWHSNIK